MRVGDQPEITTHNRECGYYDGFVNSSAHVTIPCATELVGRYVSIQLSEHTRNEHGSSAPSDLMLTLCEVVVMGYFYKGNSKIALQSQKGVTAYHSCVSTPFWHFRAEF